jgi:KDO2-lipid IV(A) lauroyltransferase
MNLEYIVYKLLRAMILVLGFIPFSVAQFIGKMAGTLAFMVPMSRKKVALENILCSFDGMMTRTEARKLLRKVYLHFGQMFLEVPHAMRLSPQNIHKYVVFDSEQNLRDALAKGKGVLALTGHFGNWELMAAAVAMHFGNSSVVARPLDFKPADQLMIDLRSRYGSEIIPARRGMRHLIRAARRNKIIGILLDQNVDWYDGTFVDFLGRPACVNKGLALLALKTGAPVIPFFSVRDKSGRYRIIIGKEVALIRTGDKTRDIEDNTALFTSIIESYVRKYPHHWFWFHKRWKTRNCCEIQNGMQETGDTPLFPPRGGIEGGVQDTGHSRSKLLLAKPGDSECTYCNAVKRQGKR